MGEKDEFEDLDDLEFLVLSMLEKEGLMEAIEELGESGFVIELSADKKGISLKLVVEDRVRFQESLKWKDIK